MNGFGGHSRERIAAAIALLATMIGCDEPIAARRIVSRPLAEESLPPAEPRAKSSEIRVDPCFVPLLALDGRSEWRYFLCENEFSNGPLISEDPLAGSLDDRRRAADLPVLHLPPHVGAAFHLPILPERSWRIEFDASFGAESALAAMIVFLSDPHPPLVDRIAPGSIRSRLRGQHVDRVVVPPPSSGSVAFATVAPPSGAASALLLVSNHGEQIQRVTSVRFLEVTAYGELLEANAIDRNGFATLELGGGPARALVIPSGDSRVTAEFAIPRNAVLSGRARALVRDESALTEFFVEIDVVGDDSPSTARIPITTSSRENGFSVDLSRFTGSRAQLRFITNRDALALAEVVVAAEADPVAPVVVFVLDGVTPERWRRARVSGARTPILDEWVSDESSVESATNATLAEFLRERIEPGRRCIVVAPRAEIDPREIDTRVVFGDGLDAQPLVSDRNRDPFEAAAATLVGADRVPGVIALCSRLLEAAFLSEDPSRVGAAFTTLDRRAGDLLRRAIDLGVEDDLELVVLLRSEDACVRLPTRRAPR